MVSITNLIGKEVELWHNSFWMDCKFISMDKYGYMFNTPTERTLFLNHSNEIKIRIKNEKQENTNK
jgi:hypothetical protein